MSTPQPNPANGIAKMTHETIRKGLMNARFIRGVTSLGCGITPGLRRTDAAGTSLAQARDVTDAPCRLQ